MSPKARQLRPQQGADDVAPGTTIRMWSTEGLDPTTVTTTNVVLKTDGHKVRGKVTYDPARKLREAESEGARWSRGATW